MLNPIEQTKTLALARSKEPRSLRVERIDEELVLIARYNRTGDIVKIVVETDAGVFWAKFDAVHELYRITRYGA